MRKKIADQILHETTKDYDRIADHFSETRAHPWPEFRFFEPVLRAGQRVLDIGCGNGRLIPFLEKFGVQYTGVDVSEVLLMHAKNLHKDSTMAPEFQVASHTDLPFQESTFDVVFSIASLYHVPSHAYRVKAVREAYRVLKPDGVCVVITWNFLQKDFFSLVIKSSVHKVFTGSRLDFKDVMRPWKDSQGQTIVKRYCHAFTRRELTSLLQSTGFTISKSAYVQKDADARVREARNIIVIGKK